MTSPHLVDNLVLDTDSQSPVVPIQGSEFFAMMIDEEKKHINSEIILPLNHRPPPSMTAFYNASSSCSSSRPLTQTEIESVKQSHTATERQQGVDALRKAYLQIFEDQDRDHKDDPLWWKKELTAMAIDLKNAMIQRYEETAVDDPPGEGISYPTPLAKVEGKLPEDEEDTLDLSLNGKLYSFALSTPVVTIGRMEGCDVKISQFDQFNLSRLHLLVFPLKQQKRFLVVDVGSAKGYETKHRSVAQGGVYRLKSQPFGRQNMLTEKEEIVVLKMLDSTLVVNPKRCVVCEDRPRHVIFSLCNHYVCCVECSRRMKECPICRSRNPGEVNRLPMVIADAAQSNVPAGINQ